MNQNGINQGSMLPVGALLRGIYRIESYLSSGGFGNTYVATNVEFDETVAIKEFFIKGVSQRDDNNTTVSVSNMDNVPLFDEQLQKFKKEARRLRKLSNDHIVRVHDLFEENGTAYYVMDYIDGENLGSRLKRLKEPLDGNSVMDYLRQVLDALETVHRQGIWHLDLKPANIMVDRDGQVSLIDFGASKQRSAKGGATSSTSVSYTNGYAPREQMEQNLEKFGPWTDIYALGATVYNLVTNQQPPLPSDIDDDRTQDKHLALPFPQNVSDTLRALVLKMMTTDRFERPQSVDEIRKLIADLSEQEQKKRREEEERKQKEKLRLEQERMKQQNKDTSTRVMKDQKKVAEPESPEPKRKINMGLMAVAAVAVIGVCLWVFLPNESSSDDEGNDTPAAVETVTDKPKTVTDLACKNSLGEYSYTGEVDNDNVPDGKGKAVYNNGKTYEGTFQKGKLHGENAVFIYDNGDIFEGSFNEDSFSQGRYTIKTSGEYFEGSFKNGQPEHGTWYDKSGNMLEKI